jgi:hypothetical protein
VEAARSIFQDQWPYLLKFLPPEEYLWQTARRTRAMVRMRQVRAVEDLLRLAMAYGLGGMSLRRTAAWAQVVGIGELSNVALLKRLRRCAGWLGDVLGFKLAERMPPPSLSGAGASLRLVDATYVSRPGSMGTDWRVHLRYDPRHLRINDVQVTSVAEGETLCRFPAHPGEVVVADMGYAHRRGLSWVVERGASFIVRVNWRNVPLLDEQGRSLDILAKLRSLPAAEAQEFPVQVAPDSKNGIPSFPARLAAIRKSPAAAAESRRRILRNRSRKSRNVDPRTLEAADYFFVLAAGPDAPTSPGEVLNTYRFRWQVELVFKRSKSLLHLDDLPAKDSDLGRVVIYAKLLGALLLEDLTQAFLGFSPWGYPVERAAAFSLENPVRLHPPLDDRYDGGDHR